MLLNNNHLNFGLAQSGNRVHHVELPVWARNNPYILVSGLIKVL